MMKYTPDYLKVEPKTETGLEECPNCGMLYVPKYDSQDVCDDCVTEEQEQHF